jgi:hypothetical protein
LIGTVSGFIPECRPTSNRNTWPDCIGICTQGRFTAIGQAMGTPKGREAGARNLRVFVEEAKASGFVAKALERSGQNATVAPASPG